MTPNFWNSTHNENLELQLPPSFSLTPIQSLIYNEDPENLIALVHCKHNTSIPLLYEFDFLYLCFIFFVLSCNFCAMWIPRLTEEPPSKYRGASALNCLLHLFGMIAQVWIFFFFKIKFNQKPSHYTLSTSIWYPFTLNLFILCFNLLVVQILISFFFFCFVLGLWLWILLGCDTAWFCLNF